MLADLSGGLPAALPFAELRKSTSERTYFIPPSPPQQPSRATDTIEIRPR